MLINIALLILLLYFVLENCVFYVTMKKETVRKINTGKLLSLKLYWNLKKTIKKCVYIHLFASLWHVILFA